MCSGNTWASPGASSIRSRSARGNGLAEGRTSKVSSVRGLLDISGSFLVLPPILPCAATSLGRDLAGYSLRDVVAGLPGGPGHPGALTFQQVLGHRLLDPGGLGGQAEMLAEQRGGQDRR